MQKSYFGAKRQWGEDYNLTWHNMTIPSSLVIYHDQNFMYSTYEMYLMFIIILTFWRQNYFLNFSTLCI